MSVGDGRCLFQNSEDLCYDLSIEACQGLQIAICLSLTVQAPLDLMDHTDRVAHQVAQQSGPIAELSFLGGFHSKLVPF